ncbi:MAG: inner-rane translocator [Actinomycetia bacterium]|jgi:ribose/xylose/arabinose/galactoside ABC-type transport system permease subunit|nr:inner-rane translocator [Actinomycetes bacterium]
MEPPVATTPPLDEQPVPTPPPAGAEVMSPPLRRVRGLLQGWGSELVVAAVIVVLSVLIGLAQPVFFSTENLLNIIQSVAVVGIAAIGATFIVISANLDLSVGSTISLCGLVCAIAMQHGLSFVPAIGVALLAGAGVGLVNGLIVTIGRVNSFIVTLGMMSAIEGLALLITGGHPEPMPDSTAWLGQSNVGPVPISVIALLGITAGAQLFLSYTIAGKRITAIGDNYRAAYLSGIPVRTTTVLSFIIGGATAAFAGVLQASSLANAQPNAGAGMVLTIVAGVIIGGTSLMGGRGSVIGTLLGATLLGVMSNAFVLLALNPEIQVISVGAVVIAAALFDQWRLRRGG